jgi:hypothetical protein
LSKHTPVFSILTSSFLCIGTHKSVRTSSHPLHTRAYYIPLLVKFPPPLPFQSTENALEETRVLDTQSSTTRGGNQRLNDPHERCLANDTDTQESKVTSIYHGTVH